DSQIQFYGTPRVLFTGMNNINLTGSSGDDTIKVLSIASGQNVVVDGQQGDDSISVGNGQIANNIKGKLKIDGGSEYKTFAGNDSVTFLNHFSGGEVDTLTYVQFNTSFLASAINYSFIDHITIVSSLTQNDVINISSTNAVTTTLTINAGGGNDVINVGNNVFALGGVATTQLTINGGSGNDMVSANDVARSGATGY